MRGGMVADHHATWRDVREGARCRYERSAVTDARSYMKHGKMEAERKSKEESRETRPKQMNISENGNARTPSSDATSDTSLAEKPIDAASPPVCRSCRRSLSAFTGNDTEVNSVGTVQRTKKHVSHAVHALRYHTGAGNAQKERRRTLLRSRAGHNH